MCPGPAYWQLTCTPSGAHRVPRAGVPAGALGAAAAVAAAEASTAALSEQREVGGDPSGGRPQDGGVPRAAQRRELRADHYEHGKAARGGVGEVRRGRVAQASCGTYRLHAPEDWRGWGGSPQGVRHWERAWTEVGPLGLLLGKHLWVSCHLLAQQPPCTAGTRAGGEEAEAASTLCPPWGSL